MRVGEQHSSSVIGMAGVPPDGIPLCGEYMQRMSLRCHVAGRMFWERLRLPALLGHSVRGAVATQLCAHVKEAR